MMGTPTEIRSNQRVPGRREVWRSAFLASIFLLVFIVMSACSTSDEVLSFWEPNAPCYAERRYCLRWAHGHGFRTSISAEPMLDKSARELVQDLGKYVSDSFWFGLPNSLMSRLSLNGAPDDVKKAGRVLLAEFSRRYVFELYLEYQGQAGIKWKESIKKLVGLEVPTQPGLDI